MSADLDIARRLVEMAGGEAEAAVVRREAGLSRFANSMIHQNVAESTMRLSLRVAVDGRVARVEGNRIDDDALQALADRAVAAARLLPVDPDWPGVAPPSAFEAGDHHDPETADAGPDVRAAHVKAFVESGDGLAAAGFVETSFGAVSFANSAGLALATRSTRATIDGIHQTGTSAGKAHETSARLADVDGGRAGAAAARLARDGVDPIDLEAGRYEVVLGPECVATVAQFLGFNGFNAKRVEEGQSFVVIGSEQLDPAISLWDDATDPRAVGYTFDSEGTPKRRVDFVDRGVSVGLAHDRRTAHKMGAESTGHAVPGGESFGAFPTNLFVGPGSTDVDGMVSAISRGLLVTEFNYCRILDPKTQVVTGLTRNGTFLVEGGHVVAAVRNLRFTQSFSQALERGRVLAVGRQARFADGEFGPGNVIAPAVHLAEWNFTGSGRG